MTSTALVIAATMTEVSLYKLARTEVSADVQGAWAVAKALCRMTCLIQHDAPGWTVTAAGGLLPALSAASMGGEPGRSPSGRPPG